MNDAKSFEQKEFKTKHDCCTCCHFKSRAEVEEKLQIYIPGCVGICFRISEHKLTDTLACQYWSVSNLNASDPDDVDKELRERMARIFVDIVEKNRDILKNISTIEKSRYFLSNEFAILCRDLPPIAWNIDIVVDKWLSPCYYYEAILTFVESKQQVRTNLWKSLVPILEEQPKEKTFYYQHENITADSIESNRDHEIKKVENDCDDDKRNIIEAFKRISVEMGKEIEKDGTTTPHEVVNQVRDKLRTACSTCKFPYYELKCDPHPSNGAWCISIKIDDTFIPTYIQDPLWKLNKEKERKEFCKICAETQSAINNILNGNMIFHNWKTVQAFLEMERVNALIDEFDLTRSRITELAKDSCTTTTIGSVAVMAEEIKKFISNLKPWFEMKFEFYLVDK